MTEELGTFVRVWEVDGGGCCFVASSENTIDAAVDRWLETNRDSLVHLTLCCGDAYAVCASRITSWRVSTPEGRRGDEMLKRAQDDENKTLQDEFGWREPD